MVEAAPTYEEYLALKDYIVFNQTEGILYFKQNVGKFSKLYTSKVWMARERRLTWAEFQENYGAIVNMMTMNQIPTY
jgi:hypothetical protein